MELPGTKVLVVGAICLSILGGIAAYKIGQIQKAYLASQPSSIVFDANATSSRIAALNNQPNNLLLSALEQAEADQAASTTSNPFIIDPKDNLTDVVAKKLFVTYAQDETSGISSASDPAFADNIINGIDTSTLPKAKYSISSITLFIPQTKTDLAAYANQFANVHQAGLVAVANTKGGKLVDIGVAYKNIANQLISMKVPAGVADAHVEIANDYAISADAFDLINDQQKDPLKAVLGLKMLQDANGRQADAYKKIALFFKNSGLTFSTEDDGYMWTLIAQAAASTSTSQQ